MIYLDISGNQGEFIPEAQTRNKNGNSLDVWLYRQAAAMSAR